MVQATIRYERQRGLDAALSRLAALAARLGRSSGRSPTTANPQPACALSTSVVLMARPGHPVAECRSPAGRRSSRAGACFAASPTSIATLLLPGAATLPARIHQLGGEINRAPYSTRIRLRTDARGNLARQPGNRNLAVFARDSHKRVRTSWHEVRAYKIRLPARPFLGVNREDLGHGPPDGADHPSGRRRWRCSVSMNSP